MARIRTIKPDFWTDEKIVQLPYEARLLFIGLWNFADDDGRLYEEPERIRMQVLPSEDIDAALLIDLLVAVGLCERHSIDGDKSVIVISNFPEHQKISNKTTSRIPLENSRKQQITTAMRRGLAGKYGCAPGADKEATCYYCGAVGSMRWWPLRNGKPSSWVSFSGLEMDHFAAEASGGHHAVDNLVLACRECNRSKWIKDGIGFISSSFPESSVALRHGREGEGKGKGIDQKPAAVVTAPKPKRKTKSALPTPFLLSTDMAKWARERAPSVDLNLETEKFCNHWRSKGETRADWLATWYNWMLRAQEYAKQPRQGKQSEPDFDDISWAKDLGPL